MKISFFIGHMGYGGAERVISLLANDYAQRGWDTQIVMLLNSDVVQTIDPRVKLVDMSMGGGSYIKRAPKWMGSIRSYFKKEKPDCVVSFIGRINALVLTAAMGLKMPIIVSERNNPRHDGRGKGMQAYCDAIYRTARAVVFQTKAEEVCFSDAVKAKGIIIPNPVSVEDFLRKRPEHLHILTAGRLAEQKNHKMLMDAVAILRSSIADIQCSIYGEGELREELEDYRKEKGLEELVELPGHSRNIHEKVAQASVFVLTSEYEGLPNALIEAMMMGVPCITTDYPGSDEVITDGETGLIIPRQDPKALAEAVLRLINEPALEDALSRQAMAAAVRYQTANVINRWREVIEG